MQRTAELYIPIACVFALLAVGHAQPQQPSTNPGAAAGDAAHTAGNLVVLSDTQRVDFGPYLSKVVQKVRTNWYKYIPQEARPPRLASGVTTIEFAIHHSGQIRGLKIVHEAGIVILDRAVWGGITACNPFDPLPDQFKGEFLGLRMSFDYNPKKLPPDQQPAPPPAEPPKTH